MFLKKICLLFCSPHKHFARELSKILGFTPLNIDLYLLAFKHKSYDKQNNERLEFLGDSILDAVVSEELYRYFEGRSEGDLSKLRSKVVSRTSLNNIGEKLNILPFLKHRIIQIDQAETNLAGNTLEALIGAVYLDIGYKGTAAFIRKKILLPFVTWETLDSDVIDYKSLLHTYSQKENVSLEYIVVSEKEYHDLAKFEIAVLVDGKVVGKGYGKNKKTAQQEAAQKAVSLLKIYR